MIDNDNPEVKEQLKNAKVMDYSNQKFSPEDTKDFEVKAITDPGEQLIDNAPGLDFEDVFQKDMYDYSEESDMPDSDLAMEKETIEDYIERKK